MKSKKTKAGSEYSRFKLKVSVNTHFEVEVRAKTVIEAKHILQDDIENFSYASALEDNSNEIMDVETLDCVTVCSPSTRTNEFSCYSELQSYLKEKERSYYEDVNKMDELNNFYDLESLLYECENAPLSLKLLSVMYQPKLLKLIPFSADELKTYFAINNKEEINYFDSDNITFNLITLKKFFHENTVPIGDDIIDQFLSYSRFSMFDVFDLDKLSQQSLLKIVELNPQFLIHITDRNDELQYKALIKSETSQVLDLINYDFFEPVVLVKFLEECCYYADSINIEIFKKIPYDTEGLYLLLRNEPQFIHVALQIYKDSKYELVNQIFGITTEDVSLQTVINLFKNYIPPTETQDELIELYGLSNFANNLYEISNSINRDSWEEEPFHERLEEALLDLLFNDEQNCINEYDLYVFKRTKSYKTQKMLIDKSFTMMGVFDNLNSQILDELPEIVSNSNINLDTIKPFLANLSDIEQVELVEKNPELIKIMYRPCTEAVARAGSPVIYSDDKTFYKASDFSEQVKDLYGKLRLTIH